MQFQPQMQIRNKTQKSVCDSDIDSGMVVDSMCHL